MQQQIDSLLRQLDTENLVTRTIKGHLEEKQKMLQELAKARENQKDHEGAILESEKQKVIEKR
jgi:hypothetical protein